MSGDVQGGDIKCIFVTRHRPDALGLKNPVDLAFNITQLRLLLRCSYPASQGIESVQRRFWWRRLPWWRVPWRPASHTSEAVLFTPDVSALSDAATDTDRYLVVLSHARRCVEGPTAPRIAGLGAERPTAPQRSAPQPPVPLTTAATTTMAATAIPTALGSAQISIEAPDERFGATARRDLPPPRLVRIALASSDRLSDHRVCE
jgi:hypothetical protein